MNRLQGVVATLLLAGAACSDSPRPLVLPVPTPGDAVRTGTSDVIKDASTRPDLLLLVESNVAHPALPSFHTVMSSLANGADVTSFTRSWLRSYSLPQSVSVDGRTLTAAARSRGTTAFECAWLRQTPSNACDEKCGACTALTLDLNVAPFELIAVVNRVDIGTDACAESGAEARLVFGAVDPLNHAPLALTVIFEYGLRGPTRDWAARFQRVRTLPTPPQREVAVGALVRDFALDAPHLLRMRTNEALFGANSKDWEFREFALDTRARALVPGVVPSSPALAFNGTAALGTWIRAHQSDIQTGKNPIPTEFQTLALGFPDPRFHWSASGDAAQDHTFSTNTCNGCHGGSRPEEPFEFQLLSRRPPPPKAVNPGSSGLVYTAPIPVPVTPPNGGTDVTGADPAKPNTVLVSRLLFDPDRPEKNELARRADVSRDITAVDCSAPSNARYVSRPFPYRVH